MTTVVEARVKKHEAFYGQRITAATMGTFAARYHEPDSILLTFETGKTLRLYDDGQSCCESRYLRTDDDLNSLVGHLLLRIEVKPGGRTEDGEYGEVYETEFLEISTTGGFVIIASHNDHNGYYGGIDLVARVEDDGDYDASSLRY